MGAWVLPRRLEDVSTGWLTTSLRDAGVLPHGCVEGVEVTSIAEGVGLMSEIGRLTASYSGVSDPAPPATFVLKLPAMRPANREMAEHYGLFERETRFYNELAPIVGVRTPRAFVSVYDPATGDAVLLLEELTVKGGDSVTVLSDDELRAIVRSMASFHGRWWEESGLVPPTWAPRLDGPTWSTHEEMFSAAWNAFASSADAAAFPALAELGPSIVPAIRSLQRHLCRSPVTLVHLDFRSSNLFLCPTSDGSVELALIDWQPLSIARGAYDLGYFLSQSIPSAQRRSLEIELLATYHDELERCGVRGYSSEELSDDYRLSVAYTSSYAVGTFLIDLANSTGRGYARETLTRAAAAVEDLDVSSVLKHVASVAL